MSGGGRGAGVGAKRGGGTSRARGRGEQSDASLILATRNAKKLAELRRILAASGVGVSVTDLSEHPDMPEVAETGATFTDNALLKARAVVAHTGRPAVAEDS